MTELLPCPFCGSPGAICSWENESGFWVNCSCGVETPESPTEARAAEQWNRRIPASAQDAPKPIGWLSRDGVKALRNDSDVTICCDNSAYGFDVPVYISPEAAAHPEGHGGWQPVETAPHETRVILGWWSALGDKWECETGYASHGWRRNGVSTMSHHGQATHWQPLPSPLPSTNRGSAA